MEPRILAWGRLTPGQTQIAPGKQVVVPHMPAWLCLIPGPDLGECAEVHVDDTAWTNRAGLSGGPHQPGAELAELRPPRAGPGGRPRAAAPGAGQVRRDHGHDLRRIRHEGDRRPVAAGQKGMDQTRT